MKTTRTMLFVLMALGLFVCGSARAQNVSGAEAVVVAENWIKATIAVDGSWGRHDTATLAGVQPFARDDEVLGYCYSVEPVGYIIVPLRRELAPVQAYSATCNLDPSSDQGLVDVLKTKMAGMLHALNQGLRKPGLTVASGPGPMLEVDYAPAWAALTVSRPSGKLGIQSDISIAAAGDTVGPLLTSSWNQTPPYNLFCPSGGGSCSGYYDGRCAAGCGPVAMAQIMRYWAWPPRSPCDPSWTEDGHFRWADMPDRLPYLTKSDLTSSDPRTVSQVHAVAALCRDVGELCGALYCWDGCGTATILDTNWLFDIFVTEMTDILVDLSYNEDIEVKDREDDTAERWFQRIQNQVNQNRPVLYAIPHHFIVADGWREVSIGGAVVKQYHMNYGWGGSYVPKPGDPAYCADWAQYTSGSNAWYTLDALPCRDLADERLVIRLNPKCAVGASVFGNHAGLSATSYVYFDQDAMVLPVGPSNVTQYMGYNCQFLPGITLRTGLGPFGSPIRFLGGPAGFDTRLFSIKGTATTSIKINMGGAVTLHDGGCLRFF